MGVMVSPAVLREFVKLRSKNEASLVLSMTRMKLNIVIASQYGALACDSRPEGLGIAILLETSISNSCQTARQKSVGSRLFILGTHLQLISTV